MKNLHIHHGRQLGTLFELLALCVCWWILSPYFFTVDNLMNVAQQTSINAIIAVGMTFVIISAGIDLSVGSIVAFSGVVLDSRRKPGFRYFRQFSWDCWPVSGAV